MAEQRQSQKKESSGQAPKNDNKPQQKSEAKPASKQEPKTQKNPEAKLPQKIEQKAPARTETKPQPKTVSKPEIKKTEPKPPPKKIRQRIADLKELAIAIDSYEDLFSDFDPRKYDDRELSEDFLYEIKRRYRETGKGQFEVIFHAPKNLHDESLEKIVIHRIKRHFRGMAKGHQKALANIRLRGILYIFFGTALLTTLTLMAYGKILPDFQIELLGVLFLPLGWFGVWEGFSKIIDVPYKLSSDLQSFGKLAKANYLFKFLE